jgi:hypothetical protein
MTTATKLVATCLIGLGILAVVAPRVIRAQPVALPADYSCSLCHRKDGDLWNESTPLADESHLADDVHWQKGLRCHDCHGGAPTLDEFKNHRDDPSFHSLLKRENVPVFCGRCHSDSE